VRCEFSAGDTSGQYVRYLLVDRHRTVLIDHRGDVSCRDDGCDLLAWAINNVKANRQAGNRPNGPYP
jgi:hypothetical protein